MVLMLAMTTVIYACCGAVRTTQPAGTDMSWAALALIAGVVVLWGSLGWHALKEWRKSESSEQRLLTVSHETCGEPDLAHPSTSPEALAEVAELEAMWRQPGRRPRASSD